MRQKLSRFSICCARNWTTFIWVFLTSFLLYQLWNCYFQTEVEIEFQGYDSTFESDIELILEYEFTAQEIIQQGRTTYNHLNHIRNFVNTYNRQPVPKYIQDELLVLFLIACKNNLELTKSCIISFYESKWKGPEIFDNRNVSSSYIQQALETVHMSVIPIRTAENDVICFFKFHDTNYQNFNITNIIKVSLMLVDIVQEQNPPNQLIVVIDAKGLGFMHTTKLEMEPVKKFIQFLQNGINLKVKDIHVINATQWVRYFIEIAKFLISNRVLKHLLHLHPADMKQEELFEILPSKYWPNDYNGNLTSETIIFNDTLQAFYRKQTFWDTEEEIRKLYS